MVLTTAIRETATKLNRERQHRAEQRLEEIVKVAGLPDAYTKHDRSGNLAVETAFARVYQLVNTDAERAAVAKAFVVWQHDERKESTFIGEWSSEAVDILKGNNDLFLNDGCGPTGRAA